MTLINTDGMAFIGPGSEWFWTAISGLVLAVTFIAIYRQLRLQSSQSTIEQLASFDEEFHSELFNRYILGILLALHDGVDPARVPDGLALPIATFWEKIGGLVQDGHIDATLLWKGSNGGDCTTWWMTLGPYIRRLRAEGHGADAYTQFEWLSGTMSELDRRSGGPLIDEAWVVDNLERRIRLFQDMIHMQQSLRAVIIESPAALPAM